MDTTQLLIVTWHMDFGGKMPKETKMTQDLVPFSISLCWSLYTYIYIYICIPYLLSCLYLSYLL